MSARKVPKAAPPLVLSVPGSPEEVPRARRRFSVWLTSGGADARVRREMELVLTELCNNALEHGAATPNRPMTLTGTVSAGELKLELTEEGGTVAGTLRRAYASSGTRPDVFGERGRGLFLVRSYVDALVVDATPDGRLRIRLTKRIRK